MLCVYLQTFEAAFFLEEEEDMMKVNNTTFPLSISTTFLGIYTYNNVTWNAHIEHINTKISKRSWSFTSKKWITS